jgi:hypothetical protein
MALAFLVEGRRRDGQLASTVNVQEIADSTSLVRRRSCNGDRISFTGRRGGGLPGGGWRRLGA